jgi:hypothetical protein
VLTEIKFGVVKIISRKPCIIFLFFIIFSIISSVPGYYLKPAESNVNFLIKG